MMMMMMMMMIIIIVFVVAPYFFRPGRSKNCIVTAVIGRALSQ